MTARTARTDRRRRCERTSRLRTSWSRVGTEPSVTGRRHECGRSAPGAGATACPSSSRSRSTARGRCRRAPGSSRRLAAGIEIPVFCYEPRLGPPVGACRMCLCEVAPGPPKPQAACTLTAADGMVVKTALTSEMAAEAQNATLEFILVNHPLDCPVCDKGGECPLQDLTFRYGPGQHAHDVPEAHVREADPDLADDRARPRALHPLLPLHALLASRSPRTGSSSRSTAARSR